MEGLDETVNGMSAAQNPSCMVATGSADRSVRVWDSRASRAQAFLFRGHVDSISSLCWGEGGRVVVSASKDKTLRIWDTRSGK